MTRGRISNIETLGGLDGPGIRTVFFLQGCPAKCAYCHNPETLSGKGGTEYTPKQVADIAYKYKPYYGNKGGVTFSGGEPLAQSGFVLECIGELKKIGVGVVIDTSGVIYAPEVLSAADLTILDIKHTDEKKFLELTGVSMDNTLRTLRYLSDNNLPFWVRQVILPDYNDDESNIRKLKTMAANAQKIELLPYHAMARHKYEKLGLPYPEGLREPDGTAMTRLNNLLHNGQAE